jgi:hypothetical protein
MELIRNIKLKRLSMKQKSMFQESRMAVRVKDFENELYIAIDGLPLLPIPNDWTASQILERLNNLREGYVNYLTKNNQSYMTLKEYADRNQSKD